MPKTTSALSDCSVTVLVPVYNDWEAASLLLKNLDLVAGGFGLKRFSVLLVDDASTQHKPDSFVPDSLAHIETINVLKLTRNLGHQRAIAVGLSHLQQQDDSDITVIMDGDGEDNPADIEKMLYAAVENGLKKIVFAERTIRSEGFVFYVFYQLYRLINWLLTGCKIRFGNFSAVPRVSLNSLVTVSELWNHYAASVVSSKIPYTHVPTARKKRYSGRSKMNFISLVTHGLSAIAVHRETVGTRILMSISLGSVLVFSVLAGVIFADGTRTLGFPVLFLGICIFIALLAQMLSILLSLVFMVLGNRDSLTFLPVRDCSYFVEKIDCFHVRGGAHGS